MEIICLASSSAGNAYLIRNERRTLLIECGLAFRELREKLLDRKLVGAPILLSNIAACLVTHKHGDHARCAKNVAQYTYVVASRETLEGADVPRYAKRYPVQAWQIIDSFPPFRITPFPVEHDCEGAFGFIIEDTETDEKLLFVNDTEFLEWDFSKHRFTHIMIECNHDDSVVNNGNVVRVANSHMNVSTTLETLAKLDLEAVEGIWLMHLSDGSSNEGEMLKAVHDATGKTVYACQKDGGTIKNGDL